MHPACLHKGHKRCRLRRRYTKSSAACTKGHKRCRFRHCRYTKSSDACRFGSTQARAGQRCLPSGYLSCSNSALIWQVWFQTWQVVVMTSQELLLLPAVAHLLPAAVLLHLHPLLHQMMRMMMRLIVGRDAPLIAQMRAPPKTANGRSWTERFDLE